MALRYLTYEDRKTLESLYSAGTPLPEIADAVGTSLATIYRELERGSTGDLNAIGRFGYSAELAQRILQESLKRRGKKIK